MLKSLSIRRSITIMQCFCNRMFSTVTKSNIDIGSGRSITNFVASVCSPSYTLHSLDTTGNVYSLPTRGPMQMSVRHVTLDLNRPRIPHKEKAVVLALVKEKFRFPLKDLPPNEICVEAVKKSITNVTQENPMERILSQEFLAEVEECPLVVTVLRNPGTVEELFETRVQLHRKNIKYMFHNNKIVHIAFKGTKYENMLQLYTCPSATLLCHDRDVSKLLKMERKLPMIKILGAVMDGRMLSVADLHKLAALPELPLVRATLLQTLVGQQQLLTRHLNHHQSDLSSALGRYSDASSSPPADTNTDGGDEQTS